MIDKGTFTQCLFNFLIYLILLIYIKRKPFYNYVERKRVVVIFYFSLLFCLYPFWAGDYFHLLTDFELLQKGELSNLENVYFPIAVFSHYYLIFRFLIWGIALWLCYIMASNFKDCQIDRCIPIFFVFIGLVFFSYARVSISMAMAFSGMSFLTRERGKVKSIILGSLLIFGSIFFHKSAVFGVLVIIIVLLTSRIPPKYLFIIAIVVTPSLLAVFVNYLELFTFLQPEESSVNLYAAQNYLQNNEKLTEGGGVMVQNLLSRLIYYLMLVIYIKTIITRKYREIPFKIKLFANSAVVIVCIATLMLTVKTINLYVLYYRLLLFAMLPTIVFLSFCYKYNICIKLVRFTIVISIFSSVYTILYSTYNTL